MGAGAFLVEAGRQIAERLVAAWARYPDRPAIPPDEDEDLHARRLYPSTSLWAAKEHGRLAHVLSASPDDAVARGEVDFESSPQHYRPLEGSSPEPRTASRMADSNSPIRTIACS